MVETRFAPYAPPSAVLRIIRHYRDRDVPERVSITNLIQLGVTEALAPRTMAALKFLGLLEDDGVTTERFRALRYAGADDYQRVFAEMLDASYKDIFDHVEVGTATEDQIANAFRPYSPGGQRSRMITLFLALCQEAGFTVAVPPRVSAPRGAKERQKSTRGRDAPMGKGSASRPPRPDDLGPRELQASLLFGVTVDDLGALDDDQFSNLWNALGVIARARARSHTAAEEMAGQAAKRRAEEATQGGE